VGRALPGVELAVAADGEVLVRGESVFAGYWGHTDGAFGQVVDGWLHTGDLGELDGDGHLRLVGRKKELIELSNGWMVSPAGVEALLNSRVPISTAVAFGEGRPHLVALLALDPVWLARTAGEHSLDGDPTAAAERVRAALHAEVAEVNAQVPEHQRIRAFAVLPRPLSPEHGELTGTLKLCRPVVYARHRDLFDALYAGESVSDRAGG
jgi:long-chain acyl-CoA synthetase